MTGIGTLFSSGRSRMDGRIWLRSIGSAVIAAAAWLHPQPLLADTLHVAAASNFRHAMTALAEQFEAASGHRVLLSFGATGKQYAQIIHGAPFDLFFAADGVRPALLENEGKAVPASRAVYAIGKLVLWSPDPTRVDSAGAVLHHGTFSHLAVASPRLAPYGEAAREVMEALGLTAALAGRLVRGENIAQTFQFVSSGNAELGFVAQSQLLSEGLPRTGSYWLVPQCLYTPIEQQVVLLKDTEPARALLDFVLGNEGRKIILQHGYDLP